MLLNSTLRTPLGSGLTLERTLSAEQSLRIVVQDASGANVFSEDLSLGDIAAPPNEPPAPEQVY